MFRKAHDPPESLGDKREQRDGSGPFNSQGQGALMFRAGTGNAPGKDLPPFGDKPAQRIGVFVVYFQFLHTKFAYLFFEKNFSLSAPAGPVLPFPAVHLRFHTPILPGRTLIFTIFFVRHKKSPVE
jgi:hypothetical protein